MKLIAATAMMIAVASGCSPSRPPWADGALVTERVTGPAGPQELGNMAARIVALHNAERSRAGVPPIAWDVNLAAGSVAYADQLARIGRLQHSPDASRPGQGENLWLGSRGAYSIEEMVGGWTGERPCSAPAPSPMSAPAAHGAMLAIIRRWSGAARRAWAVPCARPNAGTCWSAAMRRRGMSWASMFRNGSRKALSYRLRSMR